MPSLICLLEGELTLEGDEVTGASIVLRALEEPVRQNAHNAGLEESIVVERLKGEAVGVGFNAANGKWVGMVEAGIANRYKTASVVAMFLTTEASSAECPA